MEFVLERLDYTHTAGFGTAETTYDYVYSYATGKLNQLQIGGSKLWGYLTPTYDNLGRTVSHVTDMQVSGSTVFYSKVEYEYEIGWDLYDTYQVSYMANTIGKTQSTANVNAYWYEYDDLGNITKILNDNATILYQYEYDNLGQLVREDNYDKGYSYTYTYDFAGNIQTKKTYAFSTDTLGAVISTKNYTYGNSSWGDLLTNYYGDEIVYDTIGNPIRIGMYDSDFDIWYAGYELEWNGRQLTSYREFMEDDGIFYGSTYTYQYNADGIRTSKTVNGIEHKYYLNGSQILAETWKQGNVEHLLIFVYDENGSPIALKYRTNAYAENTFDFFFYEKNLQGDIIGIFNTNGRRVGWYIYDAWGTCSTYVASSTSTLEQNIVRSYNPYRYRGYYYDTETQLYYLQSRYYNPTWGRFLNADGYISTGTGILGYNMFAYCNNNPIMNVDPDGNLHYREAGGGFYIGSGYGGGGGGNSIRPEQAIVAIVATVTVGFTAVDEQQEKLALKRWERTDAREKEKADTKTKYHMHHIVAKADIRASASREILRNADIEPWTDPRNLVALPQKYHASMHTTAYHKYVEERLQQVAGDKAAVEATLAELKMEILARSAAGIRWD